MRHGFLLSLLIILALLLAGCASSGVSHGAESQADQAYLGAKHTLFGATDSSPRDAYQNASQTTKGAAIGGAAGALAGSMSSGVGIVPGLAGGAIFGGALGAYMDAHTTLADQLENRGATVVRLGDQIMMVLPSNILFNERTANIRPYAYSTLDLVAAYISHSPSMSIKVAAYSSATGPARAATALTQAQANCIVKYLWNTGIDTRMLYAVGYGGAKLVSPDTSDWASDNYRVEITLERLPI